MNTTLCQKIQKDLATLTVLFKTETYGIVGDREGKVKRCGIEFLAMFEGYLSMPETTHVRQEKEDRVAGLDLKLVISSDMPRDVIAAPTTIRDGIHGHFKYFTHKGRYYLVELAPQSGVYFETAETFPAFKFK